MPQKARTSSNKSVEKEGRVLLAVSAIKKQEIKSICEAARIFNVSDRTIRRCLNGPISRTEKRANCHIDCDTREFACTMDIIHESR
jgi:DNA invertase Pin-like site-specific DNA recombinase